jgi:metal-sulfur cluster biosynthetic enzyme
MQGTNAAAAAADALTLERVYEAIAGVLDPELDAPLVRLGFIDRVEIAGGEVTLFLKLPTFWCSPNFAYLMAADLARCLRALPGVVGVHVYLLDHFAGEQISAGVNRGASFAEVFGEEAGADADLEELRRLFLRKGFLMRQDFLLRRLLQAGLDAETIAGCKVEDLQIGPGEEEAVLLVAGTVVRLALPARQAEAYLQRGRALGLLRPAGYLFVDEEGQPIPASDLPGFLRRLRSVRLSLMFNTAMCSSLFRTRYQHLGAEEAHAEAVHTEQGGV